MRRGRALRVEVEVIVVLEDDGLEHEFVDLFYYDYLVRIIHSWYNIFIISNDGFNL